MAKNRKGVVPPHLRKFLFKKGCRNLGRKKVRAKRAKTRVVRRRRNPRQASMSRGCYIIARKGRSNLTYNGEKFTDRGAPTTFAHRSQAITHARNLMRNYPALRGWKLYIGGCTGKY